MKRTDVPTAQAECISIVGTGLSLESKHLVGGTGPLFSFGLTEQDTSSIASSSVPQMETNLVESSLVNLFGSEVSQRLIGSCVEKSTNHDSGTGMMSPNLGGSLTSLNTSFSSCIRTGNEDKDFQNTNFTDASTPGRTSVTSSSGITSVTFTLCTFNDMTLAGDGAGATIGGAALFLSGSTSSLTVDTCFFHKCTCPASSDKGGALYYFGSQIAVPEPFKISRTSFTDLSVSIDESYATVTVTTGQSISGTMGVLLDGSNVPRLVHVDFGSLTTHSNVGTITVSSGADGILPLADYVLRSAVIPEYITIPPPVAKSAETSLKDANTTTISLKMINKDSGTFWMVVEKGTEKWNIPLTHFDSETLTGTAPLYPSSAEGRLEWETEYEVTKVMWKPEGELTDIEIALSGTITFTTPSAIPRINGVACLLNSEKNIAVVELKGTSLSASKQPVVVIKGTSGQITSLGGMFSIGSSESDTNVVFGGNYELVSVGSGDSSIAVNSGLTFEVPRPPNITKIDVQKEVTTSTFVLTVTGSKLPSGETYNVNLTSTHTFKLTFSSNTAGASTSIPIGKSGELQYDTEYTIQSVTQGGSASAPEHVLFSATTFKTPLGPTLSSILCDFDSSDPDYVKVTFSTERMPLEDFTLLLQNPDSQLEIVDLQLSSTDISSGFKVVKVYEQIETLKYGTNYRVFRMYSGNVEVVHDKRSIRTPDEPIRITAASCLLGNDDKQKSAVVTLGGVKLEGGKDFNMTVQKMVESTLVGDEIVLSGKLPVDSSAPFTHSELIFGNLKSPLSYNTTYLITQFVVKDSISTVNAGIDFYVHPEPARLSFLNASLEYSQDKKKATISLSGIGMEGDYILTLSKNSSSTSNVTLTATFSAGNGTATAVLFDSSNPPIINLSYNTRYEVVGVTKMTGSFFFESGLTFTTIQEPLRLLSISKGDEWFGMDFVDLYFISVALPKEETFTLTLESVHSDATTPHQKVINLKTDAYGELQLHEAQLYPFETEAGKKKGQLEFGTDYKVVSFTQGSTSIHVEAGPTQFTTPEEPPRIEKSTNRTLNTARTELTVCLEGRKLRANLGYLYLSSDTGSWKSNAQIEVVDETHCSVRFSTADEQDPAHVGFGKNYILRTSSAGGSDVVMNEPIPIRVPSPPTIIKMEFAFSNELHTGCFLKLTGTDLIVGSSLNVTLNNSLSFIATVTSESNAQTAEMPIGFPTTTLKHNTNYEITSIEAMKGADGKTLFTPALSETTGSLPADIVIYVDSDSSSDSSLLCGDRLRPCRSIEDGWKIIESIGISSFSISILHNTTQKSQVRIESSDEVVIESGPLKKPELFVSPSSSSELEEEGMVDVSGGTLWLHQVDVVLSDSPSLIFVRMVGGQLTLEACSLSSTPSQASNSEDDLCLWSGGAIVLDHATTHITLSTFSELSFGAINVDGGSLTIETSAFHDNDPHSSDFPSLRHNIRCSGQADLKIGSLSAGDGMETPSAWISSSDCSLTAKSDIFNSPFFIPTLSSSSASKLDKTDKSFVLTIEGTTLIPCSLILEVFEKKKDGKEGQSKQFPLALNTTTSFNESTIELSLPASSLTLLDKSLEWNGRLVFGNEQRSSSFIIQLTSSERLAEAAKENMKWWLPLVLSLVCLLILTIVILFVCWRRKTQMKSKRHEDAPQELTPIDEKMEVDYEDRVTMEVSTVVGSTEMADERNKEREENEEAKKLSGVSPDLAECLLCGDGFAMCFVSRKTTLYDHLHRERQTLPNKRQCEIKLTRGLDQLARMGTYSQMLRHVTSHRILLGKDGSLNVNLEDPEPTGMVGKEEGNEGGTVGGSNAVGGLDGMNEAVRWQAPEEGKAHISPDLRQVGVFRLGLLLFEIETGSVPFGETDAVNAHRQLEMGIELAMEKVTNKSMREVITSCLQVDPTLRPSFETVAISLEGITADADNKGFTDVS
ncbi:hypothetical protein BLNAU_3466 [Blattamonas nauphoetae]|uniref:Protein kinase domain-containing protein n=1 Tax=Blattamonas nauphoetae TaxID=2049346 RepID=A0ABQ9YD24_9EUKA|nr:hypothetical protein BLNAU_3466 [Blattamonas nauphoetae]